MLHLRQAQLKPRNMCLPDPENTYCTVGSSQHKSPRQALALQHVHTRPIKIISCMNISTCRLFANVIYVRILFVFEH